MDTVVGVLSTADPHVGDTFTYTLVGGDTALFSLSGDSLRTVASFDYETKNSYNIKIRAADISSPALSYDDVFAFTVIDMP